MKVLVLNCGSSSLKCQLIDMDTEERIMKGHYDRIGGARSSLRFNVRGNKTVIEHPARNFEEAIHEILDLLVSDEYQVIKDFSEIDAVGHRIVHGGEKFKTSVIIDDEVIKAIEDCITLAPLHNPAGLAGIRACQKLLPNAPMVAVFDTSFHQTMEPKAFIYNLPYKYYEDYKIRRYGFHGTSHSFVSNRTIELLGKPAEDTKVIVCHLGGGASICAVKGGKSIDTSMGLTPLEGIVMGTRSGSIDPAIIEHIAGKEDKSIAEIMNILNKESGVYGISGRTSDFRDIDEGIKEGDKRSKIAFDVFCYQAAKIIGGYVAAMNGVDAISFTAGIGENDGEVRKNICEYLGYLGITIDSEKNKVRGEEKLISTDDSKVRVYVVPTNEELKIARETVELLK